MGKGELHGLTDHFKACKWSMVPCKIVWKLYVGMYNT